MSYIWGNFSYNIKTIMNMIHFHIQLHVNKKFEKCYTIFTGASKNRLYHLFQLADEDLGGFKAPCSGSVGTTVDIIRSLEDKQG
jgi:hypothetical protein